MHLPLRLYQRGIGLVAGLCLALSLQANTLSTTGTALDTINIYPDDSIISLSKTIQVGDDSINETYILVRLSNGVIVQKTPTGFDQVSSLSGLSNLGLQANNGDLTFDIISSNAFNLLDYPITVYVGYSTSNSGILKFGAFNVTAEFQTLSSWDETAVRKVLHAFAFGGFASDEQIQTWANMSPELAINEILTAQTSNALLSPSDVNDNSLDTQTTTLKGLSTFWADSSATHPIEADKRESFDLLQRQAAENTWQQASNLRGLNPARQRLGLWETNYHFTVNLEADVGLNNHQIARHYDDIMDAHAAGIAYQNISSIAALSSAVATQYNHRRNTYDSDTLTFRGNEDFAREYHQIFFGILGNADPTYHEEISIKNTALAFTDMPVNFIDGRLDEIITVGTDLHHAAPLEILNTSVSGVNVSEKIDLLSQVAIEHSESLTNLPILIIRGLADEQLDSAESKIVQTAWQAQTEKNLLKFLRSYAISTLFHNANRFKYLTPVERYLTALNQMTLNNQESYLNLYRINGYEAEGMQVFRPIHDVFGGLSSSEAADSPEIFRSVYNRSVENPSINNRSVLESNGVVIWAKDWGSVIKDNNVQKVAEWLWQRFLSDGLKNMGELERFHLYALLATGRDAGLELDETNPDRVFSRAEIISNASLQTAMQTWASSSLALDGDDSSTRRTANKNIGQAINFITALPFIFGQEGS